MFARIVSGHNHRQSTGNGNNSVGLVLSSATHTSRGGDYCVTIIESQQLVASKFAKNRENLKRELCLNASIPFSIIVCCLVIT